MLQVKSKLLVVIAQFEAQVILMTDINPSVCRSVNHLIGFYVIFVLNVMRLFSASMMLFKLGKLEKNYSM